MSSPNPSPDDRIVAGLSDPGDELVEWVDVDGSVIEVVARRRIRAEMLRHRCTYVVVMTGNDELVVHQRADWKDVYPSYWDLCFGGVSGVGEQWEEAARRELAEEAGLHDTALVYLGEVHYDEDDGRILGRMYLTQFDGLLDCPDGEVVATDRIPMAALDDWLLNRPVCPDSLQLVLPLLRNYRDGNRIDVGS